MCKLEGLLVSMVVVVGVMVAAPPVNAGPLLVRCEETDDRFMGVVGHGAITGNAFHTVGSEFTASCGMTRWKVRWNFHEYEKNVNLADELLLMTMTGTHLIAVPGHTPEDAPAPSTLLPRSMFLAPVPPFAMPVVLNGMPALHTFHADGVVGLLWPFSNNRDVLGYLAGVVLYHSADPLTYFGRIAGTTAGPDTALGGLVVAGPTARTASLMLATSGLASIDKAVLTIEGAEPIELDAAAFAAGPAGFRTFLAPALDLRGATGEALFTRGATVTIRSGDTELTGDVRIEGESDSAALLAGPGKRATPPASRTPWSTWLALALAAVALAAVVVVLRRRVAVG